MAKLKLRLAAVVSTTEKGANNSSVFKKLANKMAISLTKQILDSFPFKGDEEYVASRDASTPARLARAVDEIIRLHGLVDKKELVGFLQNRNAKVELRVAAISFVDWLGLTNAKSSLLELAIDTTECLQIRRPAIVTAASMAPKESLDILVRLVSDDPSAEIRGSVVAAFPYAHCNTLFRSFVELASNDESKTVRGQILRQISTYPDYDLQLAYELMQLKAADTSEHACVRAYAVEGLGYLQDERGLKTVIQYLSSAAPEIRLMAAFSLGMLGNKSHIPLLRPLIRDFGEFETWGTVAAEAVTAIDKLETE